MPRGVCVCVCVCVCVYVYVCVGAHGGGQAKVLLSLMAGFGWGEFSVIHSDTVSALSAANSLVSAASDEGVIVTGAFGVHRAVQACFGIREWRCFCFCFLLWVVRAPHRTRGAGAYVAVVWTVLTCTVATES